MEKPHPLAKTRPTHLTVRSTGMIIRAETRERWERQQLSRALQEFPDLPKGPKRPRLNSRRKRVRRHRIAELKSLARIRPGKTELIMAKLAALHARPDPPISRSFADKKRAARSKRNLRERTERVARERAVQGAARAKGWFGIGRLPR